MWQPREEEVTKEKEVEGEAGDEDVERFIAVPISATEQYLISSTGQTYLSEKLPSSMPIRHQMSLGKKLIEVKDIFMKIIFSKHSRSGQFSVRGKTASNWSQ